MPTMATRLKATGVQPQLWITSTEGTAESTFFNRRLDACRAGEQSRRTCWFDFGLPADEDPENLDSIMRYHPAAGLLWNKAQLADFREQFQGNPAGWARVRQPSGRGYNRQGDRRGVVGGYGNGTGDAR